MMLKALISSLALLTTLGAGWAQDFLQPAGPAPSFAGAEGGVDVGAAVGGGDVSATGPAAGAHAGYTFQNGPVVGGVEGDAIVGSLRGSGAGGTLSQNVVTSARVRGGWAFGNILAYGTVGPAWAGSSFVSKGFTYDKPLHGYALGVGGEVAVTRSILARAELRHYDFGSATYYMPSGAQRLSVGNNLLMVGVGARF